MILKFLTIPSVSLLMALLAAAPLKALGAEVFTLQVGSPPPPATPLVTHGGIWHYHKGTNAAQADWLTAADAGLNATWATGAGGMGYGDAAIVGQSTTLSDMQDRYATLYLRRSFEIASAPAPDLHLRLVVDYDDGFVAYLDGVELQRANLTNSVGAVVTHNATAAKSHEASCCNAPVNPATTYDLGLVGDRLAAGPHVLALHGVNQAIDSSDFHLIADLSLAGGEASQVSGNFFTLVYANSVVLSGSNTLAGSTRVVVNGREASFNAGLGTWTKTQQLVPGMNRFFIAALDNTGAILASTNRDIIAELTSTTVGGTLGSSTAWTSAMGVIHVTSDVVVPSGLTLSIGQGVVVLLAPGVSIRATAGGTVEVTGTESHPAFFLPADGTSNWGSINATGSGAVVRMRHAETAAGAVTFNSQGSGLIEDSYLHDRASIITANSAGFITLRRIHVSRFESTIFNSGTIILAEDNLYENQTAASSDALEIQGGPPGSIIRRCTFRRSSGGNSDAVDFNGTSGATVESCLIHDFSDKAISLGASGNGGAPDLGIVVSNCLIYGVNTGIAVKDTSTLSLFATTISRAAIGLHSYQKFTTPVGGGRVTNGHSNIIWGNTDSIVLANNGTASLDESDVEGLIWPGIGNISADPLFANPALHDYRLGVGSPAKGTGRDGNDMGVQWPVGGIPSGPRNLAAYSPPAGVGASGPVQLSWSEDADNESGFAIERSTDATTWTILEASVSPNTTSWSDLHAAEDQLYFYRVRATNSSGASPFSNLASAIRQAQITRVSGPLAGSNVWSPAMGMIWVVGTVTVPTNVTLTIDPGTTIKLTNGVSIRASAGGTIHVAGSEASPVMLMPLNGTNVWGEIAADGANSFLRIGHAEITGGAVKFRNGATGLMEDCYVHDYKSGTTPIAGCTAAVSVTVRRCHFSVYYETLWQTTLMTIEDSLFENANNTNSDALDFDTVPLGSVIRRCTFRHGPQSNTDAIDLGSGSVGTVVEDCLMYDFPNDKGVSIGENSFGIVIRNCLIYGCDSGVAVKDSCTASLYQNTFVQNDFGFRCYNKADASSPTGGGHITNSYNNILWNNLKTISLLNGSTLVAGYSDFEGTNVVGAGNIMVDPRFVNPAERDYRLSAGSPAAGTGRDGADMGARFPVGAPLAPSHPEIQSITLVGGVAVVSFYADSERTYTLQAGENIDGPWMSVINLGLRPNPQLMRITNSLSAGHQFFRLVSPARP